MKKLRYINSVFLGYLKDDEENSIEIWHKKTRPKPGSFYMDCEMLIAQ